VIESRVNLLTMPVLGAIMIATSRWAALPADHPSRSERLMTARDDRCVLTTLSFLAETSGQLDAFRARLKQRTQLHVSSFVECRYYGEEVYICICLEAAPQANKTLTWWMDITPREGMWLIEASVLWNGRTPVVQTPPQRVYDFQGVRAELPEILEQLLQAGAAVLDKLSAQESPADQPSSE
jgi:hypothetical protein